MLLADEYSEDPLRYPILAPPRHRLVDEAFEARDLVMVDRGPKRMNEVLPAAFNFVAVECWNVRASSVARLVFGAETQMKRLLEVKGRTGGLVSDKLNGRNLHPWLAPLAGSKYNLENCYVIGHDLRQAVPGSRAQLGLFDAWHAVNAREGHSRLSPAVPPAIGASRTAVRAQRDS